MGRCLSHELRRNTPAAELWVNDGVDEKRMDASVPSDVDPANERAAAPCAYPSQTVLVALAEPVPLIGRLTSETLGMQPLYIVGVERVPPTDLDPSCRLAPKTPGVACSLCCHDRRCRRGSSTLGTRAGATREGG